MSITKKAILITSIVTIALSLLSAPGVGPAVAGAMLSVGAVSIGVDIARSIANSISSLSQEDAKDILKEAEGVLQENVDKDRVLQKISDMLKEDSLHKEIKSETQDGHQLGIVERFDKAATPYNKQEDKEGLESLLPKNVFSGPRRSREIRTVREVFPRKLDLNPHESESDDNETHDDSTKEVEKQYLPTFDRHKKTRPSVQGLFSKDDQTIKPLKP